MYFFSQFLAEICRSVVDTPAGNTIVVVFFFIILLLMPGSFMNKVNIFFQDVECKLNKKRNLKRTSELLHNFS